MAEAIKLTIHEIIRDFESLIRSEEHLSVLIDHELANDEEIAQFHNNILEIAKKYIPNYKEFAGDDVDEINYENSLKLFKMLYENFTEIMVQL